MVYSRVTTSARALLCFLVGAIVVCVICVVDGLFEMLLSSNEGELTFPPKPLRIVCVFRWERYVMKKISPRISWYRPKVEKQSHRARSGINARRRGRHHGAHNGYQGNIDMPDWEVNKHLQGCPASEVTAL